MPCGRPDCRLNREYGSCEALGSAGCAQAETCVVTEAPKHEPNLFGTEPYGQCRPTVCEADADCRSDNLTCVDGQCRARSCVTSEDCDGYCFDGYCSIVAGRCVQPSKGMRP